MKNIFQLINHSAIRFLDHTSKETIFNAPNNALASFAIDDAIATTVGNKLVPPTIRTWVHERTVVLGIPDSRLPYIEEGVKYLRKSDYHVIIRNSGGLAVVIDKDVLNISLILPSKNQLSIHDGYNIMFQFIKYLFKEYTNQIKAFEIKGSYCPGDYDLSISGIKFAGISQRRVRDGVAIQIYIDVEGNSSARASVIKNFYEVSKQGKETKYEYPEINPQVMGSISELLNEKFTVKRLIQKIKDQVTTDETAGMGLILEEKEIFKKRLLQMHKRNEKLFLLR